RTLFREYAESLGMNLHFQDFDQELATLPGAYAPPGGTLLLARWQGKLAGCVGLRPLADGMAELKRLYVRPDSRGHGIGVALAQAAISAARQAHYAAIRLDTLPTMQAAQTLYRGLGFHEIPAYRYNPIADTVFMQLDLLDNA
ncbi:MAG: GNAT family N-acetyltransferase, partial [Pseudonocardiaceae bacterium]